MSAEWRTAEPWNCTHLVPVCSSHGGGGIKQVYIEQVPKLLRQGLNGKILRDAKVTTRGHAEGSRPMPGHSGEARPSG